MVSLSICTASWFLRRIILVLICMFYANGTRYFLRVLVWYIHTRRTFYEAKQGCGVMSCTSFSYWGACWSKILVLIWDHMYVREDLLLLIFYWNILFLVDTWSSVVVSRYDCFSVSITCGATHAGRILFDTKRKRENSGVWPFEVRVMLLRSRAWMILAGTHHTTVVSHR